jgi:hypothetical protein
MALGLIMALQAAAAVPPYMMPVPFDLAKVKPAEDGGCARGEGGEIVVCGRRALNRDIPVEELERRYREKPVRAEIGLGGGAAGRAYLDQAEMPQGQISRRIMFGIKLPL